MRVLRSCGQNVGIAAPSCLHSFLHHQACPLPTTHSLLLAFQVRRSERASLAPFLPSCTGKQQQKQLRRRRSGSFPVLAVGVLVWHFVQYVCEESICTPATFLYDSALYFYISVYMYVYIYIYECIDGFLILSMVSGLWAPCEIYSSLLDSGEVGLIFLSPASCTHAQLLESCLNVV